MPRRHLITLTLLAAHGALPVARADDAPQENWPQWRGPHANGFSSTATPPLEWSPESNIKWKTPIPGRGSASPIVWGDRLYLLTAVDTGVQPEPQDRGDEPRGSLELTAPDAAPHADAPPEDAGAKPNIHKFEVLCLDRHTGEIIWQRTAREAAPHEGMHATNSYASGSAATDGQRLYASFGSNGIYCYDLDGKLLWDQDLGDMTTRLGFGEGASPAIHGETLVVPWDQEKNSRIYGLDAATGAVKWQTPRDEPTGWAPPVVVEAAGRTQAILNGYKRSRSYDLETGEVLWECGGQVSSAIPSAVIVDDLAVCMTGFQKSAVVAIPLDASGEVTDADRVAWKSTKGAPFVPSPLLYDDKLYFVQGNTGILSCLDARTGKTIINQKRLQGIGDVYASPVGANGRIYVTARDGTTVVISDGKKIEILATNSVGEPVDASPALGGQEIYIRGEHHLFCITAE